MEKTYSVNDFDGNEFAYKPITTTAYSFTSRRPSINDSDILTALIQAAGRYCERYASDLFITWDSVRDSLEKIENGDGNAETFLFGFRENGVDHNAYILSRYNQDSRFARYEYRAMYRLDITAGRGEYGENTIEMKLSRVF